jgi:hypothetical protein
MDFAAIRSSVRFAIKYTDLLFSRGIMEKFSIASCF